MEDKTDYGFANFSDLLNRSVTDTEKQEKNSFQKNIKNPSAFGGRGGAGSTILSSRDKMILAAKATVFWHTYYKIKRRVDPRKDDKGETKTPVRRVIDKFDETKKTVKDLTKKGGILATLAKLALAVAAIFALPKGFKDRIVGILKNIFDSLNKFLWEDVLTMENAKKFFIGLGKIIKSVWNFVWSGEDTKEKLKRLFTATIIGALALAFLPGGVALIGLAAAITMGVGGALLKAGGAIVAAFAAAARFLLPAALLPAATTAAAVGTGVGATTAVATGAAARSGLGRNAYRGLKISAAGAHVPAGGLSQAQARRISRVTGRTVPQLMAQRPGTLLKAPTIASTASTASTASRVASKTARTASGALKVLSKVAAPLAGGLAAYEEHQKNKDWRRTTTKGLGVGGGIAAGAALGSIVPGLGTAVGGIIGGLVGWWGGSKGADAINKDLFPTEKEREQKRIEDLALSETGGHIAIQQLNETKISNVILQNIATLTEQILNKPNGGGVTMPAQRPVPIGDENKNSPMSYPSGMENYLNSAYAHS